MTTEKHPNRLEMIFVPGPSKRVARPCVMVESLRGATISVNTAPPRLVPLIEQGRALCAEFDIAEDEWRRPYRRPLISRIVLAGDEDM